MNKTVSVLAATLLITACNSTRAGNDQSIGNQEQAASGSDDATPAAGDVAALQNFRLSDDFLAKYESYEEEAVKNPCQLSPIVVLQTDDDKERSLDETIAAFEAKPGVSAALQRHGLTGREMVLGMATLMGAAMQDLAQKHPEMVDKGEIKMKGHPISAANMAFYHQHGDALRQHNRRIGEEQLKANGGKLPACLSG